MIGRSFATEDAHDEIRAAVIDLFEVIEDEASTDLEQVIHVMSHVYLHVIYLVYLMYKQYFQAGFFAYKYELV